MYITEARKLRLISEVLKVKSDAMLTKIEKLLKSNKEAATLNVNIADFAGFLSAEEAAKMKETIAGTCETIDENVWK